jgi:imidazolonepropionase-like amidohydrolase
MTKGDTSGRTTCVAALVVLFALSTGLSGCARERQANATRIRHVRVFDGEQMLASLQTVVIENGVITSLGSDASSDSGGAEYDGGGRVLIPGLIDSHMHAGDGVRVLQEQLVFGVTTSLGMYDDPDVARKLRVETDDGSAFKSAAMGATVPAGHGTEYGGPVPTVSAPEEADQFVESRMREGSDFLKIIIGPPRMPMLSEAAIAALVDAAHKRGRLAIAHVDRLAEARIAVRAGVDGLAHIFCDAVADDEFVSAMVERKAFVIPTLTIRQAAAPGSEWQGNPASLLQTPATNQWLTADERKELGARFAGRDDWRLNAAENVKQLARAGVTILAGSDAPNPGTAWGASLHQELELLVAAGLPPADVLSGATARAASRFGISDRGRIAPGQRADLVMLDCDPLTNIHCASEIVSVWKRGVPVDRERYRSSLKH